MTTDHSMHFARDDFAVDLTMRAAPMDKPTHDAMEALWHRLVFAVMEELRKPETVRVVPGPDS